MPIGGGQKVRSISGDPSLRLYPLPVKNRVRSSTVVSGLSCSVLSSASLWILSCSSIRLTSSATTRSWCEGVYSNELGTRGRSSFIRGVGASARTASCSGSASFCGCCESATAIVQDSDAAQTAGATKRINDSRWVPLDCQRSDVPSASNENKMSDGWRESAGWGLNFMENEEPKLPAVCSS